MGNSYRLQGAAVAVLLIGAVVCVLTNQSAAIPLGAVGGLALVHCILHWDKE
jgi:hypothetical protein